jgi:hypothetical protein
VMNSICGIYLPRTTRETVRGVARTRPIGPPEPSPESDHHQQPDCGHADAPSVE